MGEFFFGLEKVGETFEYRGKKYKVMVAEEKYKCLGCVFDNEGVLGCHEMICNPLLRGDERSVIYKEVK
jgi:hypothetical protein